MKVVAINGSSKKNGNTAYALDTVSAILNARGIETERIDIGNAALHGCIGCGACFRKKNRQCMFNDDPVNGWITTLLDADGILVGSPVYYAGINGALKSLLDRAFYVASANDSLFRLKVGAAVVAVRRAGAIAALDQIHKYFTISEMFIPGSTYWSMIYGMAPDEASQDVEGTQCAQVLGENMAWLLKLIEHGRTALPPPPSVVKDRMNFIR